MRRPAERLEGHDLEGGWHVVERLRRNEDMTGGRFSVGYLVESTDGRRAFLKAMDYREALQSSDPADALQRITAQFLFERDVLEKCRQRGLSRIVVAIEAGKIVLDAANETDVVQYLIFELADGDVRQFLRLSRMVDLAWTLRCLHHVATAMQQLHGQGIAHQDLKPSNVMVFGGIESKVGDLGRAAHQGHPAPHDDLRCAGDPSYAPPELLYGQVSPDWHQRRLGCDAYLLGNLTVFLFSKASMTALLLGKLDPSQSWREWRGSFAEILPHLQAAFGEALLDFRDSLTCDCGDELVEIVRHLCNPDPEQRGHPRTLGLNADRYSLERYVAWFDLLARRAEMARITNNVR